MKRRIVFGVSVLITIITATVLYFVTPVLAESYVQATDNLTTVAADKVVDGAVFVAGENVTVAGTVKGDVYCTGRNVMISGTVEGDILCASAGSIVISGTVDGSIRVASPNVTLRGKIAKNASIAAQNAIIEKEAIIGGDIVAGGTDITMAGVVGRDARIGADQLTIIGMIGRNIDTQVTTLRVENTAKIAGNLQYWSVDEATVQQGVVAGETHRYIPEDARQSRLMDASMPAAFVTGIFVVVVSLCVVALVVVALFPRYVRETTAYSWSAVWLPLLVGLSALFAGLPLILLLFLSVVGIPAAILLAVLYALALLVAMPLASYYVGRWMLEGRSKNMFLAAIIGAVVVGIVCSIPLIGIITTLAVFSTGLGMAILRVGAQFEQRPAYIDTGSQAAAKTTPSKAHTKKA